jgi:hypothetical protein
MKLYNMGILPSAYGNNPSTQYLVYLVPPASGEVTGTIADVIKALGVTANITPFPNLRPDEALVFVGKTPPECRYATGKAIYENFVPYGADAWNGVGMVTDADFNGTAQEYLPDNPNAKYLYVYKIARNCSDDQHCYELPYGPGGYGIGPDQPLFIGWRLYLETATKTGPSYSEIVYDRAIKFDPKLPMI